MRPLAFVATRLSEHGVDLAPCAACEIEEVAWDEFADCVAHEPALVSYPGHVFRARWEQGYAAVAVQAGHILSYTSLAPVMDAGFRSKLVATCSQYNGQLPAIDLYEFATGWTHPTWRRNDVSLALRRQLLQRFNSPNLLCVGVTVGLGASPVLSRLGWYALPWSRISYLSSLIVVPLAGYEARTGKGWMIPDGLQLYEGEPLNYEANSNHPWKQFCHFWVAQEALARRLDDCLCTAACSDLRSWRDAIVRTHAESPAPFWKLSFYREQMLCANPAR
jgi:hypothetical protein